MHQAIFQRGYINKKKCMPILFKGECYDIGTRQSYERSTTIISKIIVVREYNTFWLSFSAAFLRDRKGDFFWNG